jgi:hypothetical protein
MAKGKKTGGNDFVVGDPRAGRHPTPPDLKAARRLSKTEFERIANRFIWLSDAELVSASKDPGLSQIERMIHAIIEKAVNQGDHMRLEWFLQRLLGKVQDKVEVSQPKPFVVTKRSGEQVLLGSKVEEKDE